MHSVLSPQVTVVTGDGWRKGGGIGRDVDVQQGARNQAEKVLVALAILGLPCPLDHPGVRSDRVAGDLFRC